MPHTRAAGSETDEEALVQDVKEALKMTRKMHLPVEEQVTTRPRK